MDYHEIEIPMTLSSIKSYLEPVLCSSGLVHDNEEVVGLRFPENLNEHVWVTVCVKKRQQVETAVF